MSKGTKIALGIVGSVLGLCVCLAIAGFVSFYFVSQQVIDAATDSPEKVAEIAGGIADYDLPPGFSEQFGMSFLVFDMVTFSDDSRRQLIILTQFSQAIEMNQEDMEQQMNQSMQQQLGRQKLDLELVEQTTTTIRDESVTLTIREGFDDNGEAFRQITGVFPGKGGTALLMIMGPQQSWSQAAVDEFIASIR